MSRQLTYIARRLSPLVKGVYSRDEGGAVVGLPVVADTSSTNVAGALKGAAAGGAVAGIAGMVAGGIIGSRT